ncbi:MAG: hypothetical protein JRE20_11970 [Deltaproteobacteria bacterium]|nr:hypothetical protein [Deltaproteobacteria bacterium]
MEVPLVCQPKGDACECEGDFESDGDVDGTDAVKFKADFFRKDCPSCTFNCY